MTAKESIMVESPEKYKDQQVDGLTGTGGHFPITQTPGPGDMLLSVGCSRSESAFVYRLD